MIRPASEILKENMPFNQLFESVAIHAIKVAQREAIEASAEVAKVERVDAENQWVCDYEDYFQVSQASILNLLNEVK